MDNGYEIEKALCSICQQDVFDKSYKQTCKEIPGVFSEEMIMMKGVSVQSPQYFKFIERQQELIKAHLKLCVTMGYEEVSVCKQCLRYLAALIENNEEINGIVL